jgi:hypothetical protein
MIIDNSCLCLANTQDERFTPFLVFKIKIFSTSRVAKTTRSGSVEVPQPSHRVDAEGCAHAGMSRKDATEYLPSPKAKLPLSMNIN